MAKFTSFVDLLSRSIDASCTGDVKVAANVDCIDRMLSIDIFDGDDCAGRIEITEAEAVQLAMALKSAVIERIVYASNQLAKL